VKYEKELALERAKNTLTGLSDFKPADGSLIYDEIVALNREIATLEQDIKILQSYIDAHENANKIKPAEFEAEIAKVEASVSKFTEDIKPVASYVYSRVTKINYLSTKVVEVEGGRGLLMSLVISLIVGLVVACVVAYIVGWAMQKKTNKAAAASGVPVMCEAQLQAAATDETDDETENTKTDK
ncbi:MAG: hypothetical protein NC548_26400, partial [Lachnospiraceae bacterium]|nr:hypothetical protein [Lachnospiraceae bacterium]